MPHISDNFRIILWIITGLSAFGLSITLIVLENEIRDLKIFRGKKKSIKPSPNSSPLLWFLLIFLVLFSVIGGTIANFAPASDLSIIPVVTTVNSQATPTSSQVDSQMATAIPTPTTIKTLIPTATPNPALIPQPTTTPLTILASFDLEYCIIVKSVNVRVEPSELTNSIGSLKFNDCLYFDARTQDSQWIRIGSQQADEFTNITGGWVKSEFFRPIDFSTLPIHSWADVPANYLCVNERSLYVRENPDKDSRPIGGLTYHDCLEFDGRSDNSIWVRITLGQDDYPLLGHGWVKSEFLVPQENIQTLPIATNEPTPKG